MGNNFTLLDTKYCENGDVVVINNEKMGIVVDSNKVITLLDNKLTRVNLILFKINDNYKIVERFNFENNKDNNFEAVKHGIKFLPCVTRENISKRAINFHKNHPVFFKNNKDFVLNCLKICI